MTEILKTIGVVALVLFMAGCATRVVNTVAHLEPVPSKTEVLAEFSETQLSQGEAYYANSCAQCHKLFDPDSRNPEQWNTVLKRMIPKTQLTYDESKLVRAYLVAHSK